MGGNSLLSGLMHVFGANLEFDSLPLWSHQRRVQRLVQIGLGEGDKILEAAWNRGPQGMQATEGGIAIAHAVSDDA